MRAAHETRTIGIPEVVIVRRLVVARNTRDGWTRRYRRARRGVTSEGLNEFLDTISERVANSVFSNHKALSTRRTNGIRRAAHTLALSCSQIFAEYKARKPISMVLPHRTFISEESDCNGRVSARSRTFWREGDFYAVKQKKFEKNILASSHITCHFFPIKHIIFTRYVWFVAESIQGGESV